jgi:two-component system CheB/CheR fusion protein
MNKRQTPGPGKHRSDSGDVTEPNESRECVIVGIGASAGGLRAVSALLERLPADLGMAYVLVEHLAPQQPSHLADLLSRKSAMAVAEATDGVRIEPNSVYVIPPGKDMTVVDGHLRLTVRTETAGLHLPIDAFLRSLAADQGERAIGIILSGSAADGRLGLTAIKSGGGVTFAQDPASAEFASMPASAIAAGVVDFILPVEEIADELARIAAHPYLAASGTIPAREATPVTVAAGHEGDAFADVFSLLRSAFGVDFSGYKMTTIRRRIARRMLLGRYSDLAEYIGALRRDPDAVEALYYDILIMVTEFFREPSTFTVLRERVFPSILQDATNDAPIRLWVPGCATGEEAYSLAIAMLDVMAQSRVKRPLKLFATDINERDLQVARQGTYPESVASVIPPELLSRYFGRTVGGYQISKNVRGLCVFARHDLTRDPPFANLDLLSCRNLLIYLTADLQRRVVPVLHYALRPGGYLVLGRSESVGRQAGLFDVVDNKQKIFARKLGSSGAATFPLPAGWSDEGARRIVSISEQEAVTPGGASGLREEADKVVLAAFGPAGVTVDASLTVLDVRGRTDPYLHIRPGRPSLNLLDMLHDDLVGKVHSALVEAKRTDTRVVVRATRTVQGNDLHAVDIYVLPFAQDADAAHYLILFDELPSTTGGRRARRPTTASADVPEGTEAEALRDELNATRERLEALLSDKEAANEELRAANEETLAAGEEMQSVNEELETSQEELRSTNEELQARNVELGELGDDLGNLLTSVSFPIIMVDRDLRIRRFTPMAERVCRLIAADVSRPITDLQLCVDVPDLRALLLEVIETMVMRERPVQDDRGHWYSMQVRPYRSADGRIDGAVITFFDIDEITQRYEAQRHIAVTLQENFIHPLPEIGGLELAALSVPAGRPELVGGDFHDVFQLPDGRAVLLIGDVMGKGIVAAGVTETVRASVRALALVSSSPEDILGSVNRVLTQEARHRQLVTALLVVLDSKTGQGRMASAGHPPAMHVFSADCAPIEPSYGPPLGAFELPYEGTDFTIAPGDALVLYTDGLIEARRQGDFFGENRLCESLRGLQDQHPHLLVERLQAGVTSFADELADDLQILAARWTAQHD